MCYNDNNDKIIHLKYCFVKIMKFWLLYKFGILKFVWLIPVAHTLTSCNKFSFAIKIAFTVYTVEILCDEIFFKK